MTTRKHKVDIKDIVPHSSELEKRFVPNYRELSEIVKSLKKLGHRIVLAQGVFDLIHEGHASFLEKAKAHGDILIVGVDSDEMTRARKGPNRPIVPQAERIKMLAHLRHVDLLTIRNVKQGLGALIKLVRPHVLIVSTSTKDFTDKLVREYRPYCEKIVSLPPQAAVSSTARIRKLSIDGAQELALEIDKLVKKIIGIEEAK